MLIEWSRRAYQWRTYVLPLALLLPSPDALSLLLLPLLLPSPDALALTLALLPLALLRTRPTVTYAGP
jgi:hypothetical protein